MTHTAERTLVTDRNVSQTSTSQRSKIGDIPHGGQWLTLSDGERRVTRALYHILLLWNSFRKFCITRAPGVLRTGQIAGISFFCFRFFPVFPKNCSPLAHGLSTRLLFNAFQEHVGVGQWAVGGGDRKGSVGPQYTFSWAHSFVRFVFAIVTLTETLTRHRNVSARGRYSALRHPAYVYSSRFAFPHSPTPIHPHSTPSTPFSAPTHPPTPPPSSPSNTSPHTPSFILCVFVLAVLEHS